MTVTQIFNEIRKKHSEAKPVVSSVRYALAQLMRFDVIGRKNAKTLVYGYAYFLRNDYLQRLDEQEQHRRDNIVRAYQKSHRNNAVNSANGKMIESKRTQPIQQVGEYVRLQKLFDNLLRK